MPTLAHISDLHLQSDKPKRQVQVEPIFQKINEMKPDLIVVSGDVTDDGYKSLDELRWAKDWLDERIEGEWFAVPGNHDVGNFVTQREGVVQDQRIAHWGKVFGTAKLHTLRDWAVVGLSSMVLGSDLEAEQDQLDWLEVEQPFLAEQRLAVFMHSPLFVASIDEAADEDTAYWLGPQAGRKRVWQHLCHCAPRLIGTGHVHQTRLTEADGVTIAWVPPASGTWVHAPGLPNPPIPDKTGFFLHALHDDGRVESELIECAPMLKLYEHKPWP